MADTTTNFVDLVKFADALVMVALDGLSGPVDSWVVEVTKARLTHLRQALREAAARFADGEDLASFMSHYADGRPTSSRVRLDDENHYRAKKITALSPQPRGRQHQWRSHSTTTMPPR